MLFCRRPLPFRIHSKVYQKGMQRIFIVVMCTYIFMYIKLSCILAVIPSCFPYVSLSLLLVTWWKLMMNQMSFGVVIIIIIVILFWIGFELSWTITNEKEHSNNNNNDWKQSKITRIHMCIIITCVWTRQKELLIVILHSVIVRLRHTQTHTHTIIMNRAMLIRAKVYLRALQGSKTKKKHKNKGIKKY